MHRRIISFGLVAIFLGFQLTALAGSTAMTKPSHSPFVSKE